MNSTDSIFRNHVDICAAFLADTPNLACGGHRVYKELKDPTAARASDFRVKTPLSFMRKAESMPALDHVLFKASLINSGAPFRFGVATTTFLSL
jgi:hypothetical protein